MGPHPTYILYMCIPAPSNRGANEILKGDVELTLCTFPTILAPKLEDLDIFTYYFTSIFSLPPSQPSHAQGGATVNPRSLLASVAMEDGGSFNIQCPIEAHGREMKPRHVRDARDVDIGLAPPG